MRAIKDINYTLVNNEFHTLNIYLPERDKFKTFIYFHGGGLESGDKDDADNFSDYLNENGIAVVSCNYKLYPFTAYPEFICDAAAAVDWVFENIKNYGTATEIYIGGSSAGAYISMMLCFNKKYLSGYGINPMDINGFIHDAGQPTKHFRVLKEYGIDPKRIIVDEAAPLYYIGIEKEYPKMLFILSENDMENRYEQTMLMISTLKHYGVKANIKILQGNHGQYTIENEFSSTVAEFMYQSGN